MKHGAPVPLHGTALDVVLACRHANISTRNRTAISVAVQEWAPAYGARAEFSHLSQW